MEFELNTPFKNDLYLKRESNYFNQPKRISILSKNSINDNSNNYNINYDLINKLKNDLKEKPFNNNINYNNKEENKDNNNPMKIYTNKNSNARDMNYYLNQIYYYLAIIKPFSQSEINIKKLSFDFPLLIYTITIFSKLIFSKNFNIFYLFLLILLPISSHILLNKIIIEEYYYMNIINTKKIFFKNFFKIFFNGYILYIFGFFTVKIFRRILFEYKYVIQIMYVIYASFIGVKIFIEYIISVSTLIDKNNLRINIKERDGKKIYFIFFSVYSLISYIINI